VADGAASVAPFDATASMMRWAGLGWKVEEAPVAQLLWRSRRSGTPWSTAARQGRVLGGCLREEESREKTKGNSAPVWQLRGDKDAASTWRRLLHGLRVERRWRAVDSAAAR
jgi:hypothetical protein